MFSFASGRTAVLPSVVPAGLLVDGLTLAALTFVVTTTAALSMPPDRATDPGVTQPPMAVTDLGTDPQDAISPTAPAGVDAALDTAPPPVEEAEPAAPVPAKPDEAETADEAAEVPPPATTDTSSGGDNQLARVEAIADSLPFDWRAAGATFRIGCEPKRPTCHWGTYAAEQRVIWIGPGAFAFDARLFYVVAHETAHAWQYATDPYSRLNDMKDWRRTGADGLEAAADCLAQVWGAATTHYWNCPTEARQHMQQVFASTQ